MKLTELALQKINNTQTRMKIGLALGVSDQQVRRYVIANSDNLTKVAALAVIRQETGLTDEQILEKEEVSALQT